MPASINQPRRSRQGAPCVALDGQRARRRRRVSCSPFLALLAILLGAHVAPANAAITPPSGGRQAAFDVTFPAQAVALELEITGAGRCATLDALYISIRRAQHGDFRFGPGVPGAR